MDNHEIALQLPRKSDRRTLFPLLRMVLGQPTVPLLVNRVVIMKIRDRRNRHAGSVSIRIAKQRIQCRRATATPTPNSDARWIDEGPLRNRTSRGSLIA